MEVDEINERDDELDKPKLPVPTSTEPVRSLPFPRYKVQSRTFPRQAPKEPQSEYSMPSVNSNLYYDMDTFPRGLLTIINEKEFGDSSRYRTKPRSGSDEDAEKLTELFLDLGFYVDRHDNLSKTEINEKLKSVADEDFSKLSCYACIILSHGDEGIVHASDGDMKIRDLTSLFRTKKLEGKPKLFFFQACQGSNYMHPLEEQDGIDKNEDALPNETDFLFCHSTVQGYCSFRSPAVGSWYMQTLVKEFRENADKMDIMQMLARVNFVLAKYKSTNGYSQIGSFTSQMRKDFYFFPPYGPLPKQ